MLQHQQLNIVTSPPPPPVTPAYLYFGYTDMWLLFFARIGVEWGCDVMAKALARHNITPRMYTRAPPVEGGKQGS